MRISFKLIASFLVITAMIAVLGLHFYFSGRLIERRILTLKQVAVVGIADAAAMNESLREAHLVVYQQLVADGTRDEGGEAGDESSTTAAADALQRKLQHFERSLQRSRQANWYTGASPFQSDLDATLSKLQAKFEDHRDMLRSTLARAEEEPTAMRRFFEDRVQADLRAELLPLIRDYQHRAEREFALNTQDVERQLHDDQMQTVFFSLGALFAAGVLGIWVARSIVGPLHKLEAAARQVGKGDFEGVVEIRSRDELGLLGGAFNQMREELRATTVSRDRLEASLHEKEILLREVHHRVKNNLQIVSSFLSLQAAETKDRQFSDMLADSRERIRAMAQIHEQLHQSEDLARIDFAAYAQQLCDNLARSMAASTQQVTVRVEADPVCLPLDTAIPCGMILNELVSNAIKHAFGDSTAQRRVTVVYRAGPFRHTLGVRDSGQAARPSGWQEKNTLGTKLVHALARQLGGEVEVTTDPGTSVMVHYPIEKPEAQEND